MDKYEKNMKKYEIWYEIWYEKVWNCMKSASIELGSVPAEAYEIFRKLNQSFMQHIRKQRLIVSRSVEKLLLEASHPPKTLRMPAGGCW